MLKLDWNILFTCINVIIFYILLRKFVWKKILSAMEARKELINKELKEAEDAVNDANELKSEYESKLAGAQSESKKIIEEAEQTAKSKADSIFEEAKQESDKMIKEARVSIEKERQDALRSAKDDIAALAIDVAAKIVDKEADSFDNSAVYDDFLSENAGD